MMKSLAIFCMLLFCVSSYAQDADRLLEEQLLLPGEDISPEQYEVLLQYYEHPLDLNQCTAEDLSLLNILSDIQIRNLLSHREQYGRLLSIYELQSVSTFDQSTIERLKPFVKVHESQYSEDTRSIVDKIMNEENSYLMLRYSQTLEVKEGFNHESEGNKYLGSPAQMLMRFRVSHSKDFSVGITAKKDAGERLTYDKEYKLYGAGFYSFHFQIQNRSQLKNMVLGDYLLQYGQGLVLSAGFNIGKNAETITTVKRANIGLKPYTSTVETNYLRGLAATINIRPNLELTTYVSSLLEDASLSKNYLSGDIVVTTRKQSGLHRTNTEIASRKNLRHNTVGTNLLYTNENNKLHVGAGIKYDLFDKPFGSSALLYQKYDFTGTSNTIFNLYADYIYQNNNLFGEVAKSISGHAAIVGIVSHLSPKIQNSIVFRDYQPAFHSFHGGGLGESKDTNNEKGWYWGIKYLPTRRLEFSSYYDQFSFPWLKFQTDAPSKGYEYLLSGRYKFKKSSLQLSYKTESKAKNIATEDHPLKTVRNAVTKRWSIGLRNEVSEHLSLQTKILGSNFTHHTDIFEGMGIIQDLNVDLNKFRLSARFAVFDTEDFDARLYAYERDVLYSFSIPAYSGIGTRQYILLQYKISRKSDIWLRYARTNYRDRDTISSGLEKIEGNKKSDIKVQVRFKL